VSAPRRLPSGVALLAGRHYGCGFWAGHSVAGSGFVADLEAHGFTVEGGAGGILVEQADGGFVHRLVLDNDEERSQADATARILGAASRGAGEAVPLPVDWYVIDEAEWERTHSVLGRVEQGIDAHLDAVREEARRMSRNIGQATDSLLGQFADFGSTMRFVAYAVPVVAGLGVLAYLVVQWRKGG